MTGMVCILVDFKLRWANKPYINLKNTVRYPRSGRKYKIVATLGDLIINAVHIKLRDSFYMEIEFLKPYKLDCHWVILLVYNNRIEKLSNL